MFDTSRIYSDPSCKLFSCRCRLSSGKEAEYIVATFIVSVRTALPSANLYRKGREVILETPDENKTIKLALLLNNSMKNMK